ncbi:MAG TPA: hypothetical protein VFK54_06470 [Candidatus Limnocylindrales bacterium]|nr:hypothetical protein [Candidatus Limnocylindrales bacterium]
MWAATVFGGERPVRAVGAGAHLWRVVALEAALAAMVALAAFLGAYGARPMGEVAGALSAGTHVPAPQPAAAPDGR